MKRGLSYLAKHGPKDFYYKVTNSCKRYDVDYMNYYNSHKADEHELVKERGIEFEYSPLISVIVPCYNTHEKFLRPMIDSVLMQTYKNIQLVLAVYDDEKGSNCYKIACEYGNKDNRLTVVRLTENAGIASNTNVALSYAQGEYIALLDHDDLYEPNLMYEAVCKINEYPDCQIIYTDEDKLKDNEYFEPYFKSDFNIDLLRCNNYICHAFIVKRSLIDKAGAFDSSFDGAQDYDFILRMCENAEGIYHIPKVLYHWRVHEASTAMDPRSKLYAYDAGKRAIEAHLSRLGIRAYVENMEDRWGFYSVTYRAPSNTKHETKVSIIIPNKDQAKLLKRCVMSILKLTEYSDYEIVIVENGSTNKETFRLYNYFKATDSRIKIIKWNKAFNYSAINNYGVSKALGQYLLFLNNDTQVIDGMWLNNMLGIASREDVACVGVKLLYKNGTVQHGGVIAGLGGVAGHAFVGLRKDDNGYFCKALLKQDVSAVTAACMMVNKDDFYKAGRFDEKLAVAFNDVDLCFRLLKLNKLIVYDPETILYHYESISRGYEDSKEKIDRFNSEVNYMKETWKGYLEKGDPYYNPNLSLYDGGYSIGNHQDKLPD